MSFYYKTERNLSIFVANDKDPMKNRPIASATFSDSKPHFEVLNGLRGVAAIMVLFYHIFEAFATTQVDQIVNHGYLAVDFFFLLSGFVIAYAYDDRWGNRMNTKDFFKRRLIRLQPMVVMGAIIGALMFYAHDANVYWDLSTVSIGALIIATLLTALLIPVTPGVEVRGIGEMFPLNGPSWSLFFEYIGNILYALILRRLPTVILAVVVALSALNLAWFAIFGPYGSIGAGWQLTAVEFQGGMSRLMFAFSAGLLLYRLYKPTKIKNTFWIGTLVLVVLLAMPRIGGEENLWMNGIYDTGLSILIFPAIVYLGASEKRLSEGLRKTCKFLGDISYPLYMVHYPFIYLYYAWVKNNDYTFTESIWGAVGVIVGSFALAWLSLKLYDIPVRKYLAKKFL